MPHYNFINDETGEEWTAEHTMSGLDEYLAANPKIRQLLSMPVIGDAVSLNFQKPPSDFSKYILGRVKEKNPLGDVERKFGTIPREW